MPDDNPPNSASPPVQPVAPPQRPSTPPQSRTHLAAALTDTLGEISSLRAALATAEQRAAHFQSLSESLKLLSSSSSPNSSAQDQAALQDHIARLEQRAIEAESAYHTEKARRVAVTDLWHQLRDYLDVLDAHSKDARLALDRIIEADGGQITELPLSRIPKLSEMTPRQRVYNDPSSSKHTSRGGPGFPIPPLPPHPAQQHPSSSRRPRSGSVDAVGYGGALPGQPPRKRARADYDDRVMYSDSNQQYPILHPNQVPVLLPDQAHASPLSYPAQVPPHRSQRHRSHHSSQQHPQHVSHHHHSDRADGSGGRPPHRSRSPHHHHARGTHARSSSRSSEGSQSVDDMLLGTVDSSPNGAHPQTQHSIPGGIGNSGNGNGNGGGPRSRGGSGGEGTLASHGAGSLGSLTGPTSGRGGSSRLHQQSSFPQGTGNPYPPSGGSRYTDSPEHDRRDKAPERTGSVQYQTHVFAPVVTGPMVRRPKPGDASHSSLDQSSSSITQGPQSQAPATAAVVYPPTNAAGQRICRSCGVPGRYKEGKCVEKWGPGPMGPGTVCDRCRKKMKRVERRGTLESQQQAQLLALQQQAQAQSQSQPDREAASIKKHHSMPQPSSSSTREASSLTGLHRTDTVPLKSSSRSPPSVHSPTQSRLLGPTGTHLNLSETEQQHPSSDTPATKPILTTPRTIRSAQDQERALSGSSRKGSPSSPSKPGSRGHSTSRTVPAASSLGKSSKIGNGNGNGGARHTELDADEDADADMDPDMDADADAEVEAEVEHDDLDVDMDIVGAIQNDEDHKPPRASSPAHTRQHSGDDAEVDVEAVEADAELDLLAAVEAAEGRAKSED